MNLKFYNDNRWLNYFYMGVCISSVVAVVLAIRGETSLLRLFVLVACPVGALFLRIHWMHKKLIEANHILDAVLTEDLVTRVIRQEATTLYQLFDQQAHVLKTASDESEVGNFKAKVLERKRKFWALHNAFVELGADLPTSIGDCAK